MEESVAFSSVIDVQQPVSVGTMLTSDQIDHLFTNYSVNATFGSFEKISPLGICGRPRDLHFTSGHADWIWLTRLSFPIFLVVGTLGNVLGNISVKGDTKGPKRTFLLGMFVAD